ncbi:hypothetical protein K438DRAFT_1751087 [Mycena galopus ATCC 62051]|nr:hypothetical protein K438DRAFT_1751087 [Mycena galopus ATCC 62051]
MPESVLGTSQPALLARPVHIALYLPGELADSCPFRAGLYYAVCGDGGFPFYLPTAWHEDVQTTSKGIQPIAQRQSVPAAAQRPSASAVHHTSWRERLETGRQLAKGSEVGEYEGHKNKCGRTNDGKGSALLFDPSPFDLSLIMECKKRFGIPTEGEHHTIERPYLSAYNETQQLGKMAHELEAAEEIVRLKQFLTLR